MTFRLLVLAVTVACSTAFAAKPISLVFSAKLPVLGLGLDDHLTVVRRLEIPQERSDQLRRARRITPSLRADLERFARGIDRAPADTRFEALKNRWGAVQRDGWTVDLAATETALLEVLQDASRGQVNVVYTSTPPTRTVEFFRKRGIMTLLGEGVSSYAGSSAARVTNIHVGARNFQDRLFEGEVFSFNRMVGNINARAGYVAGIVISGDSTASGVGGGICQVSTTVFRSLFAAGLPIKERKNHSYQIHYYHPTGLDATIYQPTVDLKFTNDTQGALWFQTEWDDRRARLVVRTFGKPRRERVVIGDPVILSSTPVPPNRFVTDARLAPGQTRLLEGGARGAVVQVTRRFEDPASGQLIRSETLRSNYRPWPNTYAIGPASDSSARVSSSAR
ncbi:vancomycin resistance protein YoaR [Deinobacterium chartae]|uniref:Vancomycin resistance protein YoaR n=1 Tax=Deinobacterium chartae TaxID=521158 RepID=A0A841I4T1_9DEIO|nr:VanW family protein [Deinobacterium chartae]MBB6098972.1 vancomycin resistance protein YoaR [Deinobacterium chartae]